MAYRQYTKEQKLTNGARARIENWFEEAVERNVALDKLSVASFQQEIKSACFLGLFRQQPEHMETLAGLKAFRDQICHAMELAGNVQQALEIPGRVRDAIGMIRALEAEILLASADNALNGSAAI